MSEDCTCSYQESMCFASNVRLVEIEVSFNRHLSLGSGSSPELIQSMRALLYVNGVARLKDIGVICLFHVFYGSVFQILWEVGDSFCSH